MNARSARRVGFGAVYAIVAAAPLAWLLLPALLSPDEVPGFATAKVYERLHAIWSVATGAAVTLGFPATSPDPPTYDATTRLLGFVARLTGVVPALKAWMFISALTTLALTLRLCRRELGDGWAASAAAAIGCASPAVLAGIASGESEVLHGWALVALPLCRGWGALPVGLAMGLFAPALVPVALLPVLREPAGGARRRQVGGWAIGAATFAWQGAPLAEGIPAPHAWFSALHAAAAPERVFEIYIGFGAALAALAALAVPAARSWGVVAIAALAGSLFSSSIGPERFLLLAPLAAAVGGLRALRERAPEHLAAGSVLAAALLLAEGWKGEAVDLPLPRAPISVPSPVDAVAAGPVLDLPASPGASMRGLWFQTVHRQPIAADARGRFAADLLGAVQSMQTGACPDLRALGFSSVIARREAELHDLRPLVACLGLPDVDDGKVALWHLTAAPPESAPSESGRRDPGP